MEGVEVFVGRIGKDALDDLPSNRDRVVMLQMQLAGRGCDDIGWDIEPLIGGVGLPIDLDGRRLACAGKGRSSWGGFIVSETS